MACRAVSCSRHGWMWLPADFVSRARAWLAGRNAASLPAGRGGALEDRRDFLDPVQFARGDPLAAAGQGMAAGQRVQQHGRLGIKGRISVLAERRGRGTGEGGLEQPEITDRHLRPQDAPGDVQQFRERRPAQDRGEPPVRKEPTVRLGLEGDADRQCDAGRRV